MEELFVGNLSLFQTTMLQSLIESNKQDICIETEGKNTIRVLHLKSSNLQKTVRHHNFKSTSVLSLRIGTSQLSEKT